MQWQHGSHRLLHLKQSDVVNKFHEMSDKLQHLTDDISPSLIKRDGFSGNSGVQLGSGGTSSPSATSTSASTAGGVSTSDNTLSIVLGVVIPITVAVVLLTYLHRRHVRKQKLEDANDKHGSLDFGLGEVHRQLKRKGKKGMPEMTVTDVDAEKGMRQIRGLSMDMGSPYVLPGEIQGRSSFNSVSRDEDDPYTQANLIRSPSHSPSRPQTAKSSNAPSVYTGFNDSGSKVNLLNGAQTPSRSSPPRLDIGDSTRSSSPTSANATPTVPESAASVSRKPVGLRKRASSASAGTPTTATIQEEPPLPILKDEPTSQPTSNFSLPKNVDRQSLHAKASTPPPELDSLPLPERPERTSSKAPRVSSIDFKINEPLPPTPAEDWATYADVLGIVQAPALEQDTNSMMPVIHEPEPMSSSLMVPDQYDEHRLSASIRPLPPEDPSDNAEQRANRIRSFYKEYFDDSKGHGDYAGGDYYEDYGQEYLNEATIYDPQTGQFVLAGGAPYAEPITRRAMTPPPRGPPRARGGPRRPFSGNQGYGPRSRAYSSASGRPGPRGRAPRRPMPPPAPLSTLPTPHLLKNDTGAFSTIDFAPPPSMRDITAGRPSSPRSEQRPYSPSVRVHTPLVSPFSELSAMPSPFALRKSGTFTGLDFAPPPRFKNSDSGSDSGSVRSGRSAISRAQLHNMRTGAYHISRLAPDTVGTKDDLLAELKPKWDAGR